MKFIDLFSGIGGFHLGLHKLGFSCVFACELDKYARETYQKNFKMVSPSLFKTKIHENILNINPQVIPYFDILCAGFPCQPFSQAGQKKGFLEKKSDRGNMFFELIRIIKATKPKILFMENVRHLIKHDEGKTFFIIQQTLKKQGYNVY